MNDVMARGRRYRPIPVAAAMALLSQAGAAGTSQPPEALLAAEGDAEWGAYLATECTTCHQRGGADSGIPSITNWPEDAFIAALYAYREGHRQHEVMEMVTHRLTDEDIAALAAHFATIDE